MNIASIVGSLGIAAVAVVVTAVVAVLFFRRNPNKQVAANAVVDNIAKKL